MTEGSPESSFFAKTRDGFLGAFCALMRHCRRCRGIWASFAASSQYAFYRNEWPFRRREGKGERARVERRNGGGAIARIYKFCGSSSRANFGRFLPSISLTFSLGVGRRRGGYKLSSYPPAAAAPSHASDSRRKTKTASREFDNNSKIKELSWRRKGTSFLRSTSKLIP